jgi:hypothetical protein
MAFQSVNRIEQVIHNVALRRFFRSNPTSAQCELQPAVPRDIREQERYSFALLSRITTYMLTEPLERLSTSKAPTTSLPVPPLRLLPGGTNQLPGGTKPR